MPKQTLRRHVERPAVVAPDEIQVAPPLGGVGRMLPQRVYPNADRPRPAAARRRPEHEKRGLVPADADLATRKLDDQHVAGQELPLGYGLHVRLPGYPHA